MNNKTYSPPRPHATILEVLKGYVSEPIETVSNKPDSEGQIVKVSLVEEGSGMIGLENAIDNQEWAGIFNHILKTARVATFLGEQLYEKGETVDPDCILNTILVSHAGRRQYDEATWYPSVVFNAAQKVEAGDTAITLDLLSHAHIPPIIIEGVKAHGIGATYPVSQMNTWEKILPAYADFRVSQHVMSLQERFDDLERRGIAAGRFTQNHLNTLKEWALEVERIIFSKLQIEPGYITDENPPAPWWERYLRRLYIKDAEKNIFANMSRSYQGSKVHKISDSKHVRIPSLSWWEKCVKDLYENQKEIKFEFSKEKRKINILGIDRAIDFFRKLDNKKNTTSA